MDRPALADFLRRHRESLRPEDVGLAVGARRRTPGLRREEVAQLAVMSTDYYSRLEQQRGPQPSEQMLASLARALRLTADERDYLFRVAGHTPPTRTTTSGHVAPGLLRVLDRLVDTPALIVSSTAETLAANDLAITLFGDHTRYAGRDRSQIYRWFTGVEGARDCYPERDHPKHGRAHVAVLRAALAAGGKSSRAADLVGALLAASPEFTELWEQHEVTTRFAEHKTLVHPAVGEMELDCEALFTEDQSQTLIVLTAPPRSEAAEKLALLAVVGLEAFAADPA